MYSQGLMRALGSLFKRSVPKRGPSGRFLFNTEGPACTEVCIGTIPNCCESFLTEAFGGNPTLGGMFWTRLRCWISVSNKLHCNKGPHSPQ